MHLISSGTHLLEAGGLHGDDADRGDDEEVESSRPDDGERA